MCEIGKPFANVELGKINAMGQNRKIYYITDSYPFGNGEATFVKPELEVLAKTYKITIISCNNEKDNSDIDFTDSNNIDVLQYNKNKINPIIKTAFLIRTLFSRAFFEELEVIISQRIKLIERIKASVWFVYEALLFKNWLEKHNLLDNDSIYYTFWYFAHTLGLVFLKKQKKIAYIITRAQGYDVHGFELKGGRECCKKFMDPQLNRIFFIAEEGRKYYLNENNITLNSKHLISYLGVPCACRDMSERLDDNREGSFTIVSCSTVNKWKRIEKIIDALSLISDHSIKWVHFGDGELFEEINERANRILMPKTNIEYELAGFVDRSVIYQFYGRNVANCYILLSSSEGLPVATMEALAHGIPVIVTDVGGCYETVDDNGELLPADPSPEEIKEAIERIMISSKEQYISMREHSFGLWQRKFNSVENYKAFSSNLNDIRGG